MRATRDNMEEFLIKCGLATKREATPTAEPTPRSASDPADMPLEELVKHEDEFAERLRTLAGRVSTTKIEIGRMACVYKEEHGHVYGDGLVPRLADMSGLSVRSIYNYMNAYLVLARHPKNADLQSLGVSVQVELGRLLNKPDGEDHLGHVVQMAKDKAMGAKEVAQLVTEMLRSQRRRLAKPKSRPVPKPPANDTVTHEDGQAIEDVIAVLQRASSVEVKAIPRIAEHRQRVISSTLSYSAMPLA